MQNLSPAPFEWLHFEGRSVKTTLSNISGIDGLARERRWRNHCVFSLDVCKVRQGVEAVCPDTSYLNPMLIVVSANSSRRCYFLLVRQVSFAIFSHAKIFQQAICALTKRSLYDPSSLPPCSSFVRSRPSTRSARRVLGLRRRSAFERSNARIPPIKRMGRRRAAPNAPPLNCLHSRHHCRRIRRSRSRWCSAWQRAQREWLLGGWPSRW